MIIQWQGVRVGAENRGSQHLRRPDWQHTAGGWGSPHSTTSKHRLQCSSYYYLVTLHGVQERLPLYHTAHLCFGGLTVCTELLLHIHTRQKFLCVLVQRSPTFLAPGKTIFPWAGWREMVLGWFKHIAFTVWFISIIFTSSLPPRRSSDIRYWRLGTSVQ